MEEASGVVFVEMRDAKGWGACRGVRKARLCDGLGCTSRQSEEEAGFEMAVLQRKICVFPGEGFKGVGGFKVFVLWESFGFLKYTREGVRNDRLQKRVKTCRSVHLDRAHKHERARAGLAGGRVERV